MKRIFLTILSLFVATAISAQQAEPTAPISASTEETTLQELQAEVDALKKKTSTWDKILKHLPTVSGYIQAGYEGGEDYSNFFIKRARLNFAGDIGRKVDYKLQVEFASVKIVDLYVRYKPFTALNFQFGQFKIPFTIYNTDVPPKDYEFVNFPLVTSRLVQGKDVAGINATGRDMGLQMYGGFFKRDGYAILNYNVGVFNGEGINRKDLNTSKDVVGRVTIRPMKHLRLSASYHWGEYGEDYLKKERISAGLLYKSPKLVLHGEWIGGRTGFIDETSGEKVNMRSSGWFATASYYFTPKWMVGASFDTFLENTQISDTRISTYKLGLTWVPLKQLRCQINYLYDDYNDEVDFFSGKKGGHNGVQMMLTAMF